MLKAFPSKEYLDLAHKNSKISKKLLLCWLPRRIVFKVGKPYWKFREKN